jgi:Protein of unknown function (DUF1350)
MESEFKFIPLQFHWVAINPKPIGVVYFIGGAFFGTFPNLFYRYLLKQVFEQGYTIVAIPYRFTFRHWTVSLEMVKDLIGLRKAIYEQAKFFGYDDNLRLYLEDPTSDNPNYFWMGHSLGCKYISLLEILSDVENIELEQVLSCCVGTNQGEDIKKSLGDTDIHDVSLKNQPSLFLAPVIAGIDSAIPVPALAKLVQTLGLDVQPNVQETRCLISDSNLFGLLEIIAFAKDKQAKDTVAWFIKELSQRLLKPVVPLPNRAHLAPLGYQDGDQEIADNAIKSIQELRAKLISCYPQNQEKEEVLMKMISEN